VKKEGRRRVEYNMAEVRMRAMGILPLTSKTGEVLRSLGKKKSRLKKSRLELGKSKKEVICNERSGKGSSEEDKRWSQGRVNVGLSPERAGTKKGEKKRSQRLAKGREGGGLPKGFY